MGAVLVLGGYGLIGSALCQTLKDAGHTVIVAGRSEKTAKRALGHLPFRFCDMARMARPQDWAPVLKGVTCVINCTGALQDSAQDDLRAVHQTAVETLANAAAAQSCLVIQISAAGVSETASTAFFRTKAAGDAALLASPAHCVILRPGLVIAHDAYGGTRLLRMLAALPWRQPIVMPDTPIRTVAVQDIARAVLHSVEGRIPDGTLCDLVEDHPHRLADVVTAHRAALGFAPARLWVLPAALIRPVAFGADLLGHLGWRSPLRSTAVQVLQDGIDGDPAPAAALGLTQRSLSETLDGLRLGSADRLAARMALLMPVCVGILALFWALSGLIGLARLNEAAAHLTRIGWPPMVAQLSVAFWSGVDLILASLILWRPLAAKACLGMVAVSLIYLGLASLWTPGMWADPLGPLVKVLPGIALALVTFVMLEDR